MAEFDEKLNSILSDPSAMSQIMQLAQSLGGGAPGAQQPAPPPQQPSAPPPPGWGPPPPQTPPPPPMGGGGDLLSSLTGGLDPNLLSALRPYLKRDRQDKIERALQLARLFHLGKKFLSGWEG